MVYGVECRHLSIEGHPAKHGELADEGQRERMIDEVVAGEAAAMQSQQVAMKAADNGDQVAGVLDGIGVRGGLLMDGIGSVGDGGSGHVSPPKKNGNALFSRNRCPWPSNAGTDEATKSKDNGSIVNAERPSVF